ncbi:MAG: hypothetical protein HQL02_12710 [Nitrospirae bacterium]|nr:hypothetical protein [Nitrospirota bacterium]
MKRSLAIFVLLVVSLMGVTMWGINEVAAATAKAWVPYIAAGTLDPAGPTHMVAGQAAYVLPYLNTTTPANNMYCVISNAPTIAANNTTAYLSIFLVANPIGNISSTFTASTGPVTSSPVAVDILKSVTNANKAIAPYKTRTLSFEGTAVKLDGVTIPNSVSINASGSYSVVVVLDGQAPSNGGAVATGSLATCKDFRMACFQSSTDPKREMLGYFCSDSTATKYTY